MPPKKQDKKLNELSPTASVFLRPATPNDYRIVATVRSLQGLVNTEHKWRLRLGDAQRTEQLVNAKLRRLKQLIDQCHKGIHLLETELDQLVDEQFHQVSLEPNVNQQWANDAHAHARAGGPLFSPTNPKDASVSLPVTATVAKGAKKKENVQNVNQDGRDFATGDLTQLPPHFWDIRKQQRDALRNILQAYFSLPRLARERKINRPSSPIEMQHELDEAFRLSTPIAELMQMQQHAATPEPGQRRPTEKKSQQSQGKPPKAKPAKGRAVQQLDEAALGHEVEVDNYLFTAELRPMDFLPLPVPRGLDARMLGRVLQLRSRRLRLETSIVLFEQEMVPLQQRLVGISDMEHLGEYSISAVQPAIVTTVEEEQSLQRIRQQEDEQFASRQKGALPMSASPAKLKRGESA